MATIDERTGKRVMPMRNVPNDACVVDAVTLARLTCPFCATVCFPPCVCPGCGVGIPDGTERDWQRHITPVAVR